MENEKEIITENDVTETNSVVNNAELESALSQVADLNDKYLRAVAEIENTRRRASLDAESTARNRVLSLIEKFLPLIDAIDAAKTHEPNDEGIISISKTLESALIKMGITKIETIGQLLNPQFHKVLQVIDTPKSDEPCAFKSIPNTIVGELQSGYMFGETILRPASVVVQK